MGEDWVTISSYRGYIWLLWLVWLLWLLWVVWLLGCCYPALCSGSSKKNSLFLNPVCYLCRSSCATAYQAVRKGWKERGVRGPWRWATWTRGEGREGCGDGRRDQGLRGKRVVAMGDVSKGRGVRGPSFTLAVRVRCSKTRAIRITTENLPWSFVGFKRPFLLLALLFCLSFTVCRGRTFPLSTTLISFSINTSCSPKNFIFLALRNVRKLH